MDADLYALLGVPVSASPETLKASYRRLAHELHPDVTGGDARKTERFKAVSIAYAILSDPEKRARYDSKRTASIKGATPRDREDSFSTLFGDEFGAFIHKVRENGITADNFGDLFTDAVVTARSVEKSLADRLEATGLADLIDMLGPKRKRPRP